LTDEQWTVLEPLIPAIKPGGRPAKHSRRQIVNAILYTLRSGCQWRMLPLDYPPWHTVYDYFWQWRNSGLWEQVNTALREQVRKKAHREATPSGAIIDSQSAKTTEKGGRTVMTVARK
jgi:transposase